MRLLADSKVKLLCTISKWLSLIIIAIGVFFLYGWYTQLFVSDNFSNHFFPMKIDAALSFILAGCAVYLFHYKNNFILLCLAYILTFFLLLFVLLIFTEQQFHYNIQMDAMIYKLSGINLNNFGHMSVITSFNFICVAITLLILPLFYLRVVAQILISLFTVTSFLALLGYLFGANMNEGGIFYSQMSFYSAVSFLLISSSTLMLQPNLNIVQLLSNDLPGSVLARRLLPLVIIVPTLLGLSRLYGQASGFYDTQFGAALFTLGSIIIFVILIWINAWLINLAEVKNRELTNNILASSTYVQAIFQNIGEGIITINSDSLIETFNPKAQAIFGYDLDELLHKDMTILMPDVYRDKHKQGLNRYLKTREAHVIGKGAVELEGLRKDGTVFPLELSITESFVEGRQIFTGIVRDITERKKVDNMKNEFISVVSHELRTPLTSIQGSLALLLGGVGQDSPEKVRKLLTIAEQNSGRLIRLINDILDIEKISSGKVPFNLQIVPIDVLIKEAITATQSFAETYSINVRLIKSESYLVNVDRDRLLQVLVNLISNAVKFSYKHTEVIINVNEKDNKVVVAVTNRGVGIPKEFQAKLFQKFTQADSSSSRERGGTGLGLSISKEIIEKLNGKIYFTSTPHDTTTFYFELPLAK